MLVRRFANSLLCTQNTQNYSQLGLKVCANVSSLTYREKTTEPYV